MICRRMHYVVYRSDGIARAAVGAAKKIDLTRPKDARWPLVTKEADRAGTTDVWLPQCGMCFGPAFLGEAFRSDSALGARSTPAFDDGVRPDSGPEFSPSLTVRPSAGSAASTALTSRCTATVPIRSADKPSKQWDGRREALTQSSRLWSTGFVGPSDSTSLRVSSTTCERAPRLRPGCTVVGRR